MKDNKDSIKYMFTLSEHEKKYIIETCPKSLGVMSQENILEYRISKFLISGIISLLILTGIFIYFFYVLLFNNMLNEELFVLGMIIGIVLVIIYKYYKIDKYIENRLINIFYEKCDVSFEEFIEINKYNNSKFIEEENRWYKVKVYKMVLKQIIPFLLIVVIPFIIYNIYSINLIKGTCLTILSFGAFNCYRNIFGFFQMIFTCSSKSIIIIPSQIISEKIIKRPFLIKCM